MLTDSQSVRVYDELQQTLLELGFEAVVIDVEAEVRRGKSESARVRAFDVELPDEFSEITEVRYGKPTTFTRSIEYTPQERLVLLVDAIERASVDIGELHDGVIHILSEGRGSDQEAHSIREVSFADPISGEVRE